MLKEQRIYTAVNAIPELTNKVFWAYIDDEEAKTLNDTTSVVISLSDREVVYTLSGLTPVRSTYVLDVRGATANECESILDSIVNSLDDCITDYNIIGVAYDLDIERVRLRFTMIINE